MTIDQYLEERARSGGLHTRVHGALPNVAVLADPDRERAAGDGDMKPEKYRIEGLAGPYESMTTLFEFGNLLVREVYSRGCFREAAESDRDVLSCFNHDRNHPLGRRRAGTLRLSEDGDGLRYSVDVDPEDEDAMRIRRLVDRGTVYGSSIHFRVLSEKTNEETKDGVEIVTFRINKAEVRELGPVTEPAYEETPTKAASRSRVLTKRERSAVSFYEFSRAVREAGGKSDA